MTKNEQELIDIIRSSDNPQAAVITAIDIMCKYIKQCGDKSVPLDFCEQKS